MLRKICGILSGILLAVLAVIAALLIVPGLIGYESMAVISGSMEPGIPVGSIVYAKEADPDTLEVGDVITYQINEDTRVTHRIESVDRETQTFVTKGDANAQADNSPVSYSNVVGRVDFHVPYLGYISIYAKTPVGIGAVCGVLVVLILLTFLPEIFESEEEKSEQKEQKKQKKKKMKAE